MHLFIGMVVLQVRLDLLTLAWANDQDILDLGSIQRAVELLQDKIQDSLACQGDERFRLAPGMWAHASPQPGHRNGDFQGFRQRFLPNDKV